MATTVEYMAIGAVVIVLIISIVQAAQLSSLNEKVTQQNIVLASLIAGGADTQSTAVTQNTTSQALPPSQQMVGGC